MFHGRKKLSNRVISEDLGDDHTPNCILLSKIQVFLKPYLDKSDGLVKSLKRRFSVIPAQAGIQYFHVVRILWIPVFTGMMTFYDSII